MKICVFCSSSNAIPELYFDEANELGKLIGDFGHEIIYGGATVGLMHTVAEAARKAGARSVGIIPESIHLKRLSSPLDHEQIITPNMRERKYLMRKRSDAFIALPGGFGTLEEILEVITLKQLQYHNKPIVFVNTDGFYDSLFAQFERAYRDSFSKVDYKSTYFIAANSEEAFAYIHKYQPTELTAKWFDVPGPARF
jgi:uncharacterized protein (TIGR00730 family)